MSRVTPPVTKLSHAVRSITSTSRQSGLRDPARHALPLKSTEPTADAARRASKHESEHDRLYHTQSHTLTHHRPTSTPSITIPLMQGFRTSSTTTTTPPSTRTIDFITLPTPPSGPPLNPFSRVRVPLLPDNHTPDRSSHSIETSEASFARPEIHSLADDPGTVAVLSEAAGAEEGAWGDFALRERVEEGEEEKGVLRELWSGVVDDIFGEGKGKGAKVAV